MVDHKTILEQMMGVMVASGIPGSPVSIKLGDPGLLLEAEARGGKVPIDSHEREQGVFGILSVSLTPHSQRPLETLKLRELSV